MQTAIKVRAAFSLSLDGSSTDFEGDLTAVQDRSEIDQSRVQLA
jgi:hypothetical protein